jgi:3-oxoacyl-[acyl-carrier protein] reductase
MFSLIGKKAIITGATGGLGSEIAKIIHTAGAEVILSGTREQLLKDMVNSFGERAHYIAGNMGEIQFPEILFEQAEQICGEVDILICNAGITRDNLIIRMKDEEWRAVMDINLDAVFRLNRAAIKKMIKRRRGRIINISSVVGITGNAGQTNYTAAKAAMIAMSKSIAQEVASRNITVNCIAPGFIESPMTEVLKEEIKQQLLAKIPMGKMGSGQDVAHACAFLASDEASYITGQTIHINGGLAMI